GIAAQGMPTLSADNWLIIVVLALVNTAFAFTLWNHTLRTLTATESSVINNMMLIQIPILAWIFLGETISAQQAVGMALAGAGILIVQVRHTAVSAQRSAISEDAASVVE
ncbi:MAG: DMT family transporter, partial [Anaerolineae bacterium]|nr:DMT family transporter [Anaerolineae bacterium]